MKKQQQIKRAKNLIKGLTISWSDPDPLSDSTSITAEQVTHTSPVLRLQAMNIWRDYRDWIISRQVFLWRVDITAVFRYPNGHEQLESRRAIAHATLHNIADACEPTVKEVIRYGSNLIETRFSVVCLGDRQAQETDFEDYEAA